MGQYVPLVHRFRPPAFPSPPPVSGLAVVLVVDSRAPGTAPPLRPAGTRISSASSSLSSPGSCLSETGSAQIAGILPSRNRVHSPPCSWSSFCRRPSPPRLSDFCSSVWGIWTRRADRRRRGVDRRRPAAASLLCQPTWTGAASGFQHRQPGQQPRLCRRERPRPASPWPQQRRGNDLGWFCLPLLPLASTWRVWTNCRSSVGLWTRRL